MTIKDKKLTDCLLETVLAVRVQPNASKNEVIGLVNQELKIRIAAPPVDEKANNECLRFLAKVLDVPKSHCRVLKGEKTRSKLIQIRGMSQDECRQRLYSAQKNNQPAVPKSE